MQTCAFDFSVPMIKITVSVKKDIEIHVETQRTKTNQRKKTTKKKTHTPTQNFPPPCSAALCNKSNLHFKPRVKTRGTALWTQIKLYPFTHIRIKIYCFPYKQELAKPWVRETGPSVSIS